MAKVTVVAKVVAKKENVETVRKELLKMISPTRLEKGCLEYRLHQDNSDPALFLFYENWESPEALEQHINSAHFQVYAAAVDGLLVEKVVHRMTEVA